MKSKQAGTFWTEVGGGLSALKQGFSLWGTSPRLMLLGAIPAVIVSLIFMSAFIGLLFALPDFVTRVTWFADDWQQFLRDATRFAIGLGIAILTAWAMVAWYAAVSLTIGQPFFEKIAEQVEESLGNPPPKSDKGRAGFVAQIFESLRLAGWSLLLAMSLFFLQFVPIIGTISALILGAIFGGRLLAQDLTGRALSARGYDFRRRKALHKSRRARTNTFGTVGYLLLLVPILSVVAMPALIAGATILTREILPPSKTQEFN